MNTRQKTARKSKMETRTLALRNELWPDLDLELLWNRKKKKGFTTIPRTLPHIMQIMDSLSPKGQRLSQCYLSLWCRVFDESLVIITNENHMAYEAGFTGQRANTTWRSRMKQLVQLGFIDTKPEGTYEHILIFDPYRV